MKKKHIDHDAKKRKLVDALVAKQVVADSSQRQEWHSQGKHEHGDGRPAVERQEYLRRATMEKLTALSNNKSNGVSL